MPDETITLVMIVQNTEIAAKHHSFAHAARAAAASETAPARRVSCRESSHFEEK